MPYEVEETRYDTSITREHYLKYRDERKPNYALSLWFGGNDKDLVEKSMVGMFNGSLLGGFAASHANFMHKGRFTILSIAEKSFRHGTPFVLMGATYGVTLGLITNIRKEEGALNHALAGCASGAVLGSWYRWPQLGVWSGALLGLASACLKATKDNDLLDVKHIRRQRLFNMYRRGWFTERPNAEGKDDAEVDVSFRDYRPR